ncbi:MAG: Zn-dependent oxidoreductase, NADPH:quinone reductase, partial [Novosphingobium sp.]|nr:Zn-dependent oxidoreductase, NADPH:quinone reductase [Novosphingobium sp.]
MKTAVLQSSQGIETIQIVERDVPKPGPGQALVRLTAATLNYRDLIMAKGLIPGIAKAPELIPLSCASGVVEAVGTGVDRVKTGDRVMPTFTLGWIDGPQASMEMLGGSVDGVARQYAVFPADSLVHLPDELGDFDGATFACAGLTAWSALTQYRPTAPGDWILAHGTGGVSIAALQLAKAMGANVAITSSSDAKLNRAKALGADVTVNYRTANWADAVRQAIGGNRVANVIDTVGTAQFEDNAALLGDDGQISGIGMLGSDFSWTRPDAAEVLRPIAVGSRT